MVLIVIAAAVVYGATVWSASRAILRTQPPASGVLGIVVVAVLRWSRQPKGVLRPVLMALAAFGLPWLFAAINRLPLNLPILGATSVVAALADVILIQAFGGSKPRPTRSAPAAALPSIDWDSRDSVFETQRAERREQTRPVAEGRRLTCAALGTPGTPDDPLERCLGDCGEVYHRSCFEEQGGWCPNPRCSMAPAGMPGAQPPSERMGPMT